MTRTIIPLAIAMAACAAHDQGKEPIAISQSNDLGVVAIQLDRFDDTGDKVFELRGLDRSGEEVALVRLHIGDIADLRDYLPGDSTFGSEIMLSVTNSEQRRMVSRETQEFVLTPSDDPALQGFLALDTVSSALEREAHITFVGPARESAYAWPPTTYNCAAGDLLNTSTAGQCCFTSPYTSVYYGYQRGNTYFVNPSNQTVLRWKSDYGPCKASNGGSCGGDACYYGPNGYSRPIVTAGYANLKIRTMFYLGAQGCISQADTQPVEFPNLVGTFSAGQGCPGATPSGAPHWDY